MTPPIEFTSSLTIDTTDKEQSLVDWLDTKERDLLLKALQKWDNAKTESVESLEKLPELEDRNFRIDSTNWKEIISPNGIKVKENPEGDVREYLEEDYKGEQLFTGDEFDKDWSVIREWSATRETKKAGKKLPASRTVYRDIINKKYEWSYQDFLTGEKMIFAGWHGPHHKRFITIDRGFHLRCADDSSFNGYRNDWDYHKWFRYYGFSVRCLKD